MENDPNELAEFAKLWTRLTPAQQGFMKLLARIMATGAEFLMRRYGSKRPGVAINLN